MPSTATKIRIARFLSTALLSIGFKERSLARRHGVQFELDLREGIDLSLFLFGSFQKHVLHAIRRYVPVDGCLIDVGANIGAVALPAAAYLQHGRVIAVEPTEYAYDKLQRNIDLNPGLSQRITSMKTFIAASSASESDLVAYSSWPVGKELLDGSEKLHPVHKGAAKQAHCGQITLDDLLRQQAVDKVHFIKIDTDGHEFTVLSGASETLRTHRPVVLFEACEYLMRPPSPTFGDFAALFSAHQYSLHDSASSMTVDSERFNRLCPAGGSIDLLAIPHG